MNLTNCTLFSDEEKKIARTIIPVISCIETLLTLVGNSLVIWLFYKNRKLRTPTNTLLVNLCIVDMLYIKVFVSKTILALMPHHESKEFCSNLSHFFKFLLIITQVYLVLISIDRLIAIKYPLRYALWVTNKRVMIVCTIMWVVIIGYFVAYFVRQFSNDDDPEDGTFWRGMSRCRHNKRQKSHVKVLRISLAYFVPFTIIVVSYITSFWIALRQVKQIFPLTEHEMRRKSAFKAARTTAILIGTYFVFYTPGHIIIAVHALQQNRQCPTKAGSHIRRVFAHMSIVAAWVNPLVYTVTNADFKLALKKLWRRSVEQHSN